MQIGVTLPLADADTADGRAPTFAAWNTARFGRVDDRLRGRMAALDAAGAAVGRDPATIRRLHAARSATMRG